MPSTLHVTFCASRNIKTVKAIPTGQRTPLRFAEEIEHLGTPRIFIPEYTHNREQIFSRREPDASFGHRQAHYPGVIVEVCDLQKSQQLSYLADEYILNTNGSVNAILAFNINYEGSKRATVTMWLPEYTTVDGVEEFRAAAIIDAQV